MTDTKDVAYVREKLCIASDVFNEIFVKTKEMSEENTKLKELLKGAKEIIEWYKADCGYRDIPTELTLQHINQVLQEKE